MHVLDHIFLSNRDLIMKEDPDKPRKMRSRNPEGEEESSASPVTDVSQLDFPYSGV